MGIFVYWQRGFIIPLTRGFMIPLTTPHFTIDEINEIHKVLKSGWVSQGKKCIEFENEICKITGSQYAVAVSNCTAALFLSLKALGIGQGDEVIVADFSFPATGLAVVHTGATPVFCDVDSSTFNIEPLIINSLVTKRTKAIIPVHTFGNPCDMRSIMTIASEYDLHVIEDAACAFGSTFEGNSIGTFGDAGCFSFHARKGITTGEGGAIVTDSYEIAKYVRETSMFGVESTWTRKSIPSFKNIGYNFKMSDITAAIGVAQIKKMNRMIKQKQYLAKIYNGMFSNSDIFIPQFESPAGMHTYQSYVGVVENRDEIIEHLTKKGIECGIGTYAQSTEPVFKAPHTCTNSERLHRKTLSLPMYYLLQEEDIIKIANGVLECH